MTSSQFKTDQILASFFKLRKRELLFFTRKLNENNLIRCIQGHIRNLVVQKPSGLVYIICRYIRKLHFASATQQICRVIKNVPWLSRSQIWYIRRDGVHGHPAISPAIYIESFHLFHFYWANEQIETTWTNQIVELEPTLHYFKNCEYIKKDS